MKVILRLGLIFLLPASMYHSDKKTDSCRAELITEEALSPEPVGSRWEKSASRESGVRAGIFRLLEIQNPNAPLTVLRTGSAATLNNDTEYHAHILETIRLIRHMRLTPTFLKAIVGQRTRVPEFSWAVAASWEEIFSEQGAPHTKETAVFLGTDADFLATFYGLLYPETSFAVHRISREALLTEAEKSVLSSSAHEVFPSSRDLLSGIRPMTWEDNSVVYSTMYTLLRNALRQSEKGADIGQRVMVGLANEIHHRTLQQQRLSAPQKALFGEPDPRVETLLEQEFKSNAFNQQIFSIFLDFYDQILAGHDRVVIYDIGAVGAQPFLLYGMLRYMQHLQTLNDIDRDPILHTLDTDLRNRVERLLLRSELADKSIRLVIEQSNPHRVTGHDVVFRDAEPDLAVSVLVEEGKTIERAPSEMVSGEPPYRLLPPQGNALSLLKTFAAWQTVYLEQSLRHLIRGLSPSEAAIAVRVVMAVAENDITDLTPSFIDQYYLRTSHPILPEDVVLRFFAHRDQMDQLLPESFRNAHEKTLTQLKELPLNEDAFPEETQFIGALEHHRAATPNILRGPVDGVEFLAEETRAAQEKPTIAIRFEGVLIHSAGTFDTSDRPNTALLEQLQILRSHGFRIVLWGEVPALRFHYFFRNHPELVAYFDRIIPSDGDRPAITAKILAANSFRYRFIMKTLNASDIPGLASRLQAEIGKGESLTSGRSRKDRRLGIDG